MWDFAFRTNRSKQVACACDICRAHSGRILDRSRGRPPLLRRTVDAHGSVGTFPYVDWKCCWSNIGSGVRQCQPRLAPCRVDNSRNIKQIAAAPLDPPHAPEAVGHKKRGSSRSCSPNGSAKVTSREPSCSPRCCCPREPRRSRHRKQPRRRDRWCRSTWSSRNQRRSSR